MYLYSLIPRLSPRTTTPIVKDIVVVVRGESLGTRLVPIWFLEMDVYHRICETDYTILQASTPVACWMHLACIH